MKFSFIEPSDLNGPNLARLASEPVYALDSELGHISHLLISPGTSEVEWAVVESEVGQCQAIPVQLIDIDDVNEAIKIELDRNRVEALFEVTAPGGISYSELFSEVANIKAELGGNPEFSPKLSTGATNSGIKWDVLPLHSAYKPVTGIEALGLQPPFLQESTWIEPPPSERALVADLPKSVKVASRFSIEVKVAEVIAGSVPADSVLNVEGGMTVTVNAKVPESFDVQSELTQDITVPVEGDSDPCLFTCVPGEIGAFPVRLTAYNQGKYLGKLDLMVSVAKKTSGTSRETLRALSQDPPRGGEVSLQITYSEGSNTFSFLFMSGGEHRESPSRKIEGDIRDMIESLVLECDSYARANSDLSPADAEQRLKVRGFQLWSRLVPDDIKAAIVRNLRTMSQLTIFSDREIVPWELLYPQLEDGTELGFLVELCPVNRWVMESPWNQILSLYTPTFVVPGKAPRQAQVEVTKIAGKLNAKNPPTLTNRESVLAAVSKPGFTCLHFACHNLYTFKDGSQIRFEDGPLIPADFELEVKRLPLRDKQALVFLNACRTQGSAPVYTSLESWATMFLKLGATAVIGTSWAVRSTTARAFAEHIYDNLAAGKNLGQAVAAARLKAKARTGDSSWLAYTVYGDPKAVAVTAQPS
jgi:hypothetical protein